MNNVNFYKELNFDSIHFGDVNLDKFTNSDSYDVIDSDINRMAISIDKSLPVMVYSEIKNKHIGLKGEKHLNNLMKGAFKLFCENEYNDYSVKLVLGYQVLTVGYTLFEFKMLDIFDILNEDLDVLNFSTSISSKLTQCIWQYIPVYASSLNVKPNKFIKWLEEYCVISKCFNINKTDLFKFYRLRYNSNHSRFLVSNEDKLEYKDINLRTKEGASELIGLYDNCWAR